MIVFKKAISPVVATVLLLVVVVVSIVSFQNWFYFFSSETFIKVEKDSNFESSFKINALVGDDLFLKSSSNVSILSINVLGNNCSYNKTFKGNLKIDLTECIQNLSGEVEVLVVTEEGIYSNFYFIDNKINSNSENLDSDVEALPTDFQCYNSSNIGIVGSWQGCNNMLIVDRSMLFSAVEEGDDFYISYGNINYTFGDSEFNVFIGQVTDISTLFSNKLNFNSSINYWDTSSLTNINNLFYRARSFDKPINSWNVSNVRFANYVFYQADSFNQSLDNWDTQNIEFTDFMFAYTKNFNQDISSWNTSSFRYIRSMFSNAEKFNQPLITWDMSSVELMETMFWNAREFNQPLDNWNLSSAVSMNNLFRDASSFDQDLSSWCIPNILSRPSSFDSGSLMDSSDYPIWGTCP